LDQHPSEPLSGWHSEDVKAAVRKRGHTLVSLARKNRLSDSYLRNTLMRPLYRGEQIIARFVGVPAELIWPERYHADGTPKNRKRRHRRRA